MLSLSVVQCPWSMPDSVCFCLLQASEERRSEAVASLDTPPGESKHPVVMCALKKGRLVGV